ncbi:lipopolysaccharide biosynthesis protein [Chryseobacterium aquaticum]|uniref:Polysaccharide biosynthesis protein n=1 Tax=Chryseobacterium aquaticum subsp. greenlandense TaxID=345663 RepID=A0A101CL71_9FLAO|nr:hypothetical protein [Chryseobacterium aquaticum]KUJ58252.1 hypothetical protein AR686_00125 [Chryseobacterium aquaticum subsp. greenlandense]
MSSNKKVFKNTFILYFRGGVTLLIGLYSSRILLKSLGVEDFGIYNVVGGIVGLFSFLHYSLSDSTTRFLNLSINDSFGNFNKVFNSSLVLHFILAFLILVLSETIGLWFFYNKMNIPNNRVDIAFWVYQFSVIASIISILQVPYDSAILSKEKIDVYAYISVLESFLKLFITFVISYIEIDRLFSYSLLLLILYFIIRLVYQIYCRLKIPETKFAFNYDSKVIKDMFVFFSWIIFGNLSVITFYQGVNLLQNMFFGAVINASIAIGNQIKGSMDTVAGNFLTAIRPRIYNAYIKGEIDELRNLLYDSSRFSFLLICFISIPIYFNVDTVLVLWLGSVPNYSNIFIKMLIITMIINSCFYSLSTIIHAIGKLFIFSSITGFFYILGVLLTYYFLKSGYPPTTPYFVQILLSLLIGLSNLLIVRYYIKELTILKFFAKVILRIFIIFLISFLGCKFIGEYFYKNNVYITAILQIVFNTSIILIIGLNNAERNMVKNKLLSKLSNKTLE